MSLMADPMIGLLSFQHALNTGMSVTRLDDDYVERFDEIGGGVRYSYAKVVDEEVQALATFGTEDPVHGVDCYSVNYAVVEEHRGRGLAAHVVNKGIEELTKKFSQTQRTGFYVDAIVDVKNTSSIKLAEKLFFGPGKAMIESDSGGPALHFKRLIKIR